MLFQEENCNYKIWNKLFWFDCKLFSKFNALNCVLLLPCKLPILTIYGILCIPSYKGLCKPTKQYKQINIYHI